MQREHYKDLGEALGMALGASGLALDGDCYGMSTGDRVVFLEGLARVKQCPLREVWEDADEAEIEYAELDRYSRALAAFKANRGLLDYTDMLEEFVRKAWATVPALDVLIVDEAQDLSPVQWQVVEAIAAKTARVYMAGDDDQAVFRWAGADVDAFMGLQGNVRVLDQSYRIPATVHGLAAQIARRMAKRTPKAWKPRAERGAIRWYADADEVDLSTGTWLLLARNGYMLADLEDMCQRQGLSFSSVSRNPLASAELKAVIIWEKMRRGQSVSKDDAFAVLRFISQRHIRHEQRIALRKTGADVQVNLTKGADSPPWFDALDKMSEEYVEFFRAARKRGETLTGTPRIRISTIHTAKGLEADHVLLLTDMSQRTYQEMERKPDSEHRVWYVAVTRARQGLHLIQAKTQYSFDL
jgi:DNA helicase-2/ATP-dependent DNA helicase PcrA